MQLKPFALHLRGAHDGKQQGAGGRKEDEGTHRAGWGLGLGRGREKFDGDVFIFGAINVIAIKLYIEIH